MINLNYVPNGSVRPNDQELRRRLTQIARRYPPDLVDVHLLEVDRIAFQLGLVLDLNGPSGRLCDVGGGIGLFSIGCAGQGLTTSLVDDFGDLPLLGIGDEVLSQHRQAGVTIHACNVLEQTFPFARNSLDVITCFHSMEHWHASPKRLFGELFDALVPGGVLILEVPNCVHLLRRAMVLFGTGKWSTMADWYEQPVFRGHVREPDLDDLRYLGAQFPFREVSYFGRNWLWYRSRFRTRTWYRSILPVADTVVRAFPGLCYNLYMIARK